MQLSPVRDQSTTTGPRVPEQRVYRIAWDDPGDWAGDRVLELVTEDHKFSAIYSSGRVDLGQPEAARAVRELLAGVQRFDPKGDPAATRLPASWYRAPSAPRGEYAFGFTHIDSEPRMHYSGAAGPLAQASAGATAILDLARAVWRHVH